MSSIPLLWTGRPARVFSPPAALCTVVRLDEPVEPCWGENPSVCLDLMPHSSPYPLAGPDCLRKSPPAVPGTLKQNLNGCFVKSPHPSLPFSKNWDPSEAHCDWLKSSRVNSTESHHVHVSRERCVGWVRLHTCTLWLFTFFENPLK